MLNSSIAMSWIDKDPTLKVGNTALTIESERLKLISSNLANSQVPKYRALKCNFERALVQSLKSKKADIELVSTHPSHIQPANVKNVSLPTEEEKVSFRVDQNTVDVEKELAELSTLQIRYNAALDALAHRVKLIKLAIDSSNTI